MLEKSVIEHCSPTLASIKTGNLFTYKYESEEELWESVEGFNECVREKGVSLTVLRRSEKKALIYVCRIVSGISTGRCDRIYQECRAEL